VHYTIHPHGETSEPSPTLFVWRFVHKLQIDPVCPLKDS